VHDDLREIAGLRGDFASHQRLNRQRGAESAARLISRSPIWLPEVLTLLLRALDRETEPAVLDAILHALGTAEDHESDLVLGTDAKSGLVAGYLTVERIRRLAGLATAGRAEYRRDFARILPEIEPEGPALAAIAEALMPLATDSDADVRDWATFSLAIHADTVDSPEIRVALGACVDDPDLDTRAQAALGLARRHAPGTYAVVRRQLRAGTVSRWTVRAAGCLGDRRLLPELEALRGWSDDPDDIGTLIIAMRRCGGTASWTGPDGFRRVLERSHGPRARSIEAAEQPGEGGKTFHAALAKLLKTGDDHARWSAVSLLVQRWPEETRSAGSTLLHSRGPVRRSRGAELLGALCGYRPAWIPEVAEALTTALDAETDEHTALFIVFGLARAASFEGDEPPVVDRSNGTYAKRAWRWSVETPAPQRRLVWERLESRIPRIVELASDNDADARGDAAWALGQFDLGRPPVLDTLIRLSADPEPNVRARALEALAWAYREADGEAARAALLARSKDDAVETRGRAICGLALRRAWDGVDLLRAEIVRGVGVGFVPEGLLRAAFEVGDAALLPALEEAQRRWPGWDGLLAAARESCSRGRTGYRANFTVYL
jgi:HEAT repeat protein